MREIKFRAWSNAERKMYRAEKSDKFTIDFYGGVIFNKDTWADDLVIMQYTGLKDKNGKEIYEGDVIKDSYLAGYETYQVRFGEYDNGEFYEDNCSGNGWYLQSIFEHYYVEKWKEQAYDKLDNTKIRTIQPFDVIGNIYENPELLTK